MVLSCTDKKVPKETLDRRTTHAKVEYLFKPRRDYRRGKRF